MELKRSMASSKILKVDPDRMHYRPITNIFVRAKYPDGTFKNADLAYLDRASLRAWLAVDAQRACNTVLVLLGYPIE